MKPKKIILLILLLLAIGLVAGGYLYNKRVPGLENTVPDFELTADALFNAFDLDEEEAMKLYEGKVISVTGEVLNVVNDSASFSVTLAAENAMIGGVNCSFQKETEGISIGDQIKVKGRCRGFLLDVIMNNSCLDQ